MERNGETIKMQSFDDLNPCGIRLLEENQANVDLEIEASIVQHEFNSILHKEQQTAEYPCWIMTRISQNGRKFL